MRDGNWDEELRERTVFSQDRYRKWMSACENHLVNTENRFEAAAFEEIAKAVMEKLCLDDGGLALARRLRRVIRRLAQDPEPEAAKGKVPATSHDKAA